MLRLVGLCLASSCRSNHPESCLMSMMLRLAGSEGTVGCTGETPDPPLEECHHTPYWRCQTWVYWCTLAQSRHLALTSDRDKMVDPTT